MLRRGPLRSNNLTPQDSRTPEPLRERANPLRDILNHLAAMLTLFSLTSIFLAPLIWQFITNFLVINGAAKMRKFMNYFLIADVTLQVCPFDPYKLTGQLYCSKC